MKYSFSQWVDIVFIYGSLAVGVAYLVLVFLILSGA